MDWMTMPSESSLSEKCHRILEEKGGTVADKAKAILLEDVSFEGLEPAFRYVSQVWRDPLVPALVVLSCEAVGGEPNEDACQASTAISLLNLSFRLWDDVIDRSRFMGFVPTVLGKFGDGISIIMGGVVFARAFSILSEMDKDREKRKVLNKLVWNYCRTMGKAETLNLELRKRKDARPEEKIKVFEMEAMNLETSMKIGSILGDGSKNEIEHLGKYGTYLGLILELARDLKASLNLTLELSQKVNRNALPYTLLWARDRSKKTGKRLQRLMDECNPTNVRELVRAVLETGAVENTLSIVNELAQKATDEISSLEDSHSSAQLALLAEAQHEILTESLCHLQS